jgi:hypothetical protein
MQLRPATAPVDLGSSRTRLVARLEPALFLAAYLLCPYLFGVATGLLVIAVGFAGRVVPAVIRS